MVNGRLQRSPQWLPPTVHTSLRSDTNVPTFGRARATQPPMNTNEKESYERPCDSTFILESHACLSSNQLSFSKIGVQVVGKEGPRWPKCPTEGRNDLRPFKRGFFSISTVRERSPVGSQGLSSAYLSGLSLAFQKKLRRDRGRCWDKPIFW